jgi:hypothetical protein
MATLAEELVDFIVTKLATATPAVTITKEKDIWASFLPEQITYNPASVLIDNGGPPVNTGVPRLENTIQVLTRAQKTSTDIALDLALRRATHIHNILHLMAREDLGDIMVLTCIAQNQPADIGKDESGRTMISANYRVVSYVQTETTKARNAYGGDWSPNIYA